MTDTLPVALALTDDWCLSSRDMDRVAITGADGIGDRLALRLREPEREEVFDFDEAARA